MKTVLAFSGVALALMLASPAGAATLYDYDALGRISVVTYDNGKQIVYSYDAAGNRSQVVTQTGSNRPPVAVPDSVSSNSGTAVIVHVLANDSDPDGDTLTIQSVTTPAHGTATITGSGTTVTYTPTTAAYSGPDNFGYTISDGNGHTASAPVALTVINQPPVAVNDNPSIDIGVPTQVPVLANDSDPEGGPLTITSVTTPSRGTAVITGSTITYSTIGGSHTSDSFVYTIVDDHRNTAHATVSVTVTGSNHPPIAHDDELDIFNTGVPVTPEANFDPRTNDTDPDGDPLTITAVTQGAKGHVSIINSGTGVNYTYSTPVTHDLITTDSFTYTISDGNGGSATATVTVNINVQTGA